MMCRSPVALLVLAGALTVWPPAHAQAPAEVPGRGGGTTSPAAAAAPHARNLQPAFTLPYKSYQANFPTLGVIKEVRVKEGDAIKKGDFLMRQDDGEERAELRVLDAAIRQAESGIAGEQAKLRVAELEYKSKLALKQSGAFNDLELERALAERDVAAAQLEQARNEVEQAKARRDKQALRVEDMTLKAEVDGVVRELIGNVGSNTDPTRPVLSVVQNDPLLVEVQVPTLASLHMRKGDKLRVSYDRKTWRDGAVSFLSPQADAQSGMRMLRLELANPQGDPSGFQAFVELPEKLTPAAAGR